VSDVLAAAAAAAAIALTALAYKHAEVSECLACLASQQVCAAEWGRGRVVNVWGANTRVEWRSLQKALQHYFCGTLTAPHSGAASHLSNKCHFSITVQCLLCVFALCVAAVCGCLLFY
jgi:hypothetical protein